MRQGLGSRHRPGRQVLAQVSPRFQRGSEAFCQSRKVEQHELATFLNREPTQFGGIHTLGTEQLGGGAKAAYGREWLPNADYRLQLFRQAS